MAKRGGGILPVVVAASALTGAARFAAALNAFPGAEGYGAETTGARGSPFVYHVTSLSDANTTGTFRYGVTHNLGGAAGQTIVFDVGGQITMNSKINITVPNLTIAGQTAPGPGITLTGWDTYVAANNVVLRYMRFRPGDTNGPRNGGTYQGDSLSTFGSSSNIITNVILDHVSSSWSIDENMSTTFANRVTVQNSIMAEGLNDAGHDNGSGGTETHAYGSLVSGGSGQITYAHNLYESNRSRNPRVGDDITLEFVNNITYNWNGMDGYSGSATEGITKVNYVGNYGIAGPTTTSHKTDVFTGGSTNTLLYQAGNMIDGNRNGVLDGSNTNWSMFTGTYTQQALPFASGAYPVTVDSALGAYNGIVQGVGASLTRDATDTRLVGNVVNQTGAIIDSQTQVEYLAPTMVARPVGYDTDNDGVPNTWESGHGLNPTVADSSKLNPLGYTMLEQFLNETALGSTPVRVWSATSGDWNTPAKWTASIPTMYELASIQGAGGNDGTVTLSTAAPTCLQLSIGAAGSAAGEKVQLVGGSLTVVDTIFVGNANAGTLQIDSGTVQAEYLVLGSTSSGSTYTGTLSMNGGMLKTRQIALGGGTPGSWNSGGAITFNGGTIQGLGDMLIKAPITLSGTGIVDTNGFNAIFSGAINGGGGFTKQGTGTLTLAGTAGYSGATTVAVDTLLVTATGSAIGSISGAGKFELAAGKTLTSDAVTTATWTLDANATHTVRSNGVSTSSVDTLTLAGAAGAWTATLDLTNNALIVQTSAASKSAEFATLSSQVTQGKNGGTWNGKGITSSVVAVDAGRKTVAVIDNALLGLTLFGGRPVDGNSLLIEPTWQGDTNLDQRVDVTDLGVLATNYGNAAGNGLLQGDFNGDGKIDVTDLGILATNYGAGTGGVAFAVATGAVPEPTSLWIALGGVTLMLRRPRRR